MLPVPCMCLCLLNLSSSVIINLDERWSFFSTYSLFLTRTEVSVKGHMSVRMVCKKIKMDFF